jgi:hypothetical protein
MPNDASTRYLLRPHPVSQSPDVLGLAVELQAAGDCLSLDYQLAGDPAKLRIPAPAARRRTDELWRHTCFEAFVAPAGSTAYAEFNFSPSGAWAAYRFDAYREGMAALALRTEPRVEIQSAADGFELQVALDLGALPPIGAGHRVRCVSV